MSVFVFPGSAEEKLISRTNQDTDVSHSPPAHKRSICLIKSTFYQLVANFVFLPFGARKVEPRGFFFWSFFAGCSWEMTLIDKVDGGGGGWTKQLTCWLEHWNNEIKDAITLQGTPESNRRPPLSLCATIKAGTTRNHVSKCCALSPSAVTVRRTHEAFFFSKMAESRYTQSQQERPLQIRERNKLNVIAFSFFLLL